MKIYAKKNSPKSGEIYIYDVIGFGGGVTAKGVREELSKLEGVEQLDIIINSPGGQVFEAVAILNQFRRFEAKKIVHIDALAASAASIIAMAGDEITIAANAMIMIHDPWGFAIGNAAELREVADRMDKVRDSIIASYARTKLSEKEISDLMSAETWMNAEEALEKGFVDSIIGKEDEEETETQNLTLVNSYKNTPQQLRDKASHPRRMVADMGKHLRKMQFSRKEERV